tara:strand:+ start:523 stop:831 length:309 start_codon:yes stop_codon:yes gene_type:complete
MGKQERNKMVLPVALVAAAASGGGAGGGWLGGGFLASTLGGLASTEEGRKILKTLLKSLIRVKTHQWVYNSFKNNNTSDAESRVVAVEIANEVSNTIGEALF